MRANHEVGPTYPVLESCIGGYPSADNDAYFELSCYGYCTVAFSHADRDDAVKRMLDAEKLTDLDYIDHVRATGSPDGFDYNAVYRGHASLIS